MSNQLVYEFRPQNEHYFPPLIIRIVPGFTYINLQSLYTTSHFVRTNVLIIVCVVETLVMGIPSNNINDFWGTHQLLWLSCVESIQVW